MLRVADVFKRIERIKKDLEYVRNFAEKWRDQRERFPQIYEGILAQEREFERKIEELRNLPVNAGADALAKLLGAEDAGAGSRTDKGTKADALGIEHKVRKRSSASERAEARAKAP